MTEVEVNGVADVNLDISATKTALAASSTTTRLGTLHVLEERLSNNGRSLNRPHKAIHVLMLSLKQKSARDYSLLCCNCFSAHTHTITTETHVERFSDAFE